MGRKEHWVLLFPLSIVLIALLPIPTGMLDLFLSIQLAGSFISFFWALSLKNEKEAFSYPSVLLYLTLFRLGLNVASTRLILSSGVASPMILAMGKFMVCGSFLSSFSVLLILFFMNFLLIAKGGERIAEVRARFALESLPGKQMGLDLSISSGKRGFSETEFLRKEVVQESDFFSSMEGVFRFVKGDAIIGVVIFGVNLLSASFFSLGASDGQDIWLTVLGDGLVSQISAILSSVGASTVIAKVGKECSIAELFQKEFSKHTEVLFPSAFMISLLSCIPGIPFFPILVVSMTLFLLGYSCQGALTEEGSAVCFLPRACFAEKEQCLALYQKVSARLKKDLGVDLPRSMSTYLDENSSNVSFKFFGSFFVLQSLDEDLLYEQLKTLSSEFITAREIEKLLKKVEESLGIFVDELIPSKISRDQFLIVCKKMVGEGISLDLFPYFLESLMTLPKSSSDIESITEHIRACLGEKIGRSLLKHQKTISIITLDPNVEQMLCHSYSKRNPNMCDKIIHQLEDLITDLPNLPVIVTGIETRLDVAKIVRHKFPRLLVLSHHEMPKEVNVHLIGVISEEVLI